jgi:hypothetical protein
MEDAKACCGESGDPDTMMRKMFGRLEAYGSDQFVRRGRRVEPAPGGRDGDEP